MNTQEIEKEIIKNYCDLKYGLIKSGKSLGVGEHRVRKILVENNIPIRSFSEAAKQKVSNAYSLNFSYFNTESPNMAYLLGFLASDGTIRKDSNEIKITVAEKDSEILENFKKELGYGGAIRHYEDNKGYFSSTLCFASKEIKDKLAEYNIVPQKTLSFTFPKKLDRKYWKDFIRGYFDGDGSISSAGPSAIRAQICSANKSTLEDILIYLNEEFEIPIPNIQVRNGKNPLYYFQYSSVPTRSFFEAVYYKDCLCLKRKYDKFLELIPRNLK